MYFQIFCILSIAIISAQCAALIKKSPKNKEEGHVKVEVTLSEGDKKNTALINKIMLAGEQVQVEAGLVDAAKPLMDYMMKESIAFISKQKKSSSTSTTTKSDSGKSTEGKAMTGAASNTSSTVEKNQHLNTKAFNKKVLNQVIYPLMEIYLKDVPTEVRRIINSANKMVTLNNGGMNATTSNASGAALRDFSCGPVELATYLRCSVSQGCGTTCVGACACSFCHLLLPQQYQACCF